MKYLLASDLDGTLFRKGSPLPEDVDAISRWQKQGNLFCLCSGRAPLPAIDAMNKYHLQPDLLICSNGASAVDMSGNIIFRHLFPNDLIPSAYEISANYHCTSVNMQTYEGELLRYCLADSTFTNTTLEDLLSRKDNLQFNFVFMGHPEDAIAFTNRINNTFPQITAHRNGVYIDCSVRGVDKSTGVAEAAAHFGIPLDCCYTVGDNQNDLPMLLRYHGAVIDTGDPYTIKKVGHTVPNIAAFTKEILAMD